MGEARVEVREDVQLVSVGAFRDKLTAVAEQADQVLGMSLRDGPFRSMGMKADALGVGPRKWLFVRCAAGTELADQAGGAFEGLAAVNEQSDAYVVVEVSGPGARRLLAKGVAVDLRPASFTTATVAVTTVAHTNIVLWRMESDDESPRFCLAIPRSYRESFVGFLQEGGGRQEG